MGGSATVRGGAGASSPAAMQLAGLIFALDIHAAELMKTSGGDNGDDGVESGVGGGGGGGGGGGSGGGSGDGGNRGDGDGGGTGGHDGTPRSSNNELGSHNKGNGDDRGSKARLLKSRSSKTQSPRP